jgi:isopentenyldiphosphate isomerase
MKQKKSSDRKENIDMIRYDWKRQDEAEKEIRKILLNNVYPTLNDDEIEDLFYETKRELEETYDELNELEDNFVKKSKSKDS